MTLLEPLFTKNLTFVRNNNIDSINYEQTRKKWKHFEDFRDFGMEQSHSLPNKIVEELKIKELNQKTLTNKKAKKAGLNLTIEEVNNLQ